jgi:DNA-directed RNA polymerase subunit RPC12/RpoP
MPIEFFCQTCHSKLRTPDETAGKLVRCPKCSQLSRIPSDQFVDVGEIDEQPEFELTAGFPALKETSAAPSYGTNYSPGVEPPYQPDAAQNPYARPTADMPDSRYRMQPSGVKVRESLMAPGWMTIVVSALAMTIAFLGVASILASMIGQRVRDDDVGGLVMVMMFGGMATLSLLGGFAMVKQRFYLVAMLGSISMLLWGIFCCLIPLPIAIWSLVVLASVDTKLHFN